MQRGTLGTASAARCSADPLDGALGVVHGAGSISGNRPYRKPGIRMVTPAVADNEGCSTTAKHNVTV
ncbi:hypothetical protein [Massilia arenae]|uniref:Uncharacterized protein n=1 Tax=Massilia arenae TaxID=2603288 RepID=A0A5C7FVJ6_9BURK|nr:hypothetical protein [Massilia arenae]TXF98929.1 hypothetical protein FVD38_14075 [Massilia arenae]